MNIMTGIASITITGKGNYEGTVMKAFNIAARSIENATVDSISDVWYTRAEQQPVPNYL